MNTMERFDVEWCCWAASGWEDAGEGTVRDARKVTRGQAAAFFAREVGDIRDVRVWKRYIRPFTREEIWLGPGRDRWTDREKDRLIREGLPRESLAEIYARAPVAPPEDWQPDEYDSTWCFVDRSHPDAIPAWICGFKGDDPPEVAAKCRQQEPKR